MENPNLIFVPPSLIAGDKSMVNVIAHEIAHSWTGNLVTMSNWSSFWLNEGFTRFIERKIIEKIYGKDIAMLESQIGYNNMVQAINKFGKEGETFTTLNPKLGRVMKIFYLFRKALMMYSLLFLTKKATTSYTTLKIKSKRSPSEQ